MRAKELLLKCYRALLLVGSKSTKFTEHFGSSARAPKPRKDKSTVRDQVFGTKTNRSDGKWSCLSIEMVVSSTGWYESFTHQFSAKSMLPNQISGAVSNELLYNSSQLSLDLSRLLRPTLVLRGTSVKAMKDKQSVVRTFTDNHFS